MPDEDELAAHVIALQQGVGSDEALHVLHQGVGREVPRVAQRGPPASPAIDGDGGRGEGSLHAAPRVGCAGFRVPGGDAIETDAARGMSDCGNNGTIYPPEESSPWMNSVVVPEALWSGPSFFLPFSTNDIDNFDEEMTLPVLSWKAIAGERDAAMAVVKMDAATRKANGFIPLAISYLSISIENL